MDEKQISYQLETIVDKIGLKSVLNYIGVIADEKAEHIRENWQDENLAKTWQRDSQKIGKLIEKIEN